MWYINDTDYAERFYPKLCGGCKYWHRNGRRTSNELGLLPGECMKLHIAVHRTEWCKEPDELKKHKETMQEYATNVEYRSIMDRRRRRNGADKKTAARNQIAADS